MVNLDVHLLPQLIPSGSLDGGLAVVIDVLRATTTICHALAAGAVGVVPCREIDEAREAAERMTPRALLGGERGGLPIDGFDLGNSPTEYTSAKVAGRVVAFTTSNGTRALHACRSAETVLLAAFVNLSAICDRLAAAGKPVHLVCAGTDGQVTREDVLLAGAIAQQLARDDEPTGAQQGNSWVLNDWVLNDQAEIARDAWRSAVQDLQTPRVLAHLLSRSGGGRNLLEIGRREDIELAGEVDRVTVVPVWTRPAAGSESGQKEGPGGCLDCPQGCVVASG